MATDTLTTDGSSFSLVTVYNGGVIASCTGTVISYDNDLNHLEVSVTIATDTCASSADSTFFITYDIIGDVLTRVVNASGTYAPAVPAGGQQYTKQ